MKKIDKSKKKKIILWTGLLLIVFLSFTSFSWAQKTVLTFWMHHHPPAYDFYTTKIIPEYERLNPGVEIEYSAIPYPVYQQKLPVALAGGTGPDIFGLGDWNITEYVTRGQLEPVDPIVFGFKNQEELEKAWMQSSLKGLKFGGKIYCLPWEYNTFSLFINNEHFREAGLDPNNSPKTWEELLEIGKLLTKKEAGKVVRAGFDWVYGQAIWYMLHFSPLLWQLGGSILTPEGTESAMSTPAGVNSLKMYANLASIAGAEFGADFPTEDFATEKVSMWISGVWYIPWALQINPDLDFSVAPLPTFKGKSRTTVLYAWGWCVNSQSRKKTEAWRFIDFLTRKAPEFFTEIAYVQPRTGWLNDPQIKKSEMYKYLPVFLDDFKYGRYLVRSEHYSEIQEAMVRAIERVAIIGIDPEESIKILESDIKLALR